MLDEGSKKSRAVFVSGDAGDDEKSLRFSLFID